MGVEGRRSEGVTAATGWYSFATMCSMLEMSCRES